MESIGSSPPLSVFAKVCAVFRSLDVNHLNRCRLGGCSGCLILSERFCFHEDHSQCAHVAKITLTKVLNIAFPGPFQCTCGGERLDILCLTLDVLTFSSMLYMVWQ